jgi:type VI secretion system protein VasI
VNVSGKYRSGSGRLTVLAAFSLFTGSVVAKVEVCHSLPDSKRLFCYDTVSGRKSAEQSPRNEGKQFDLLSETSKLTDETNVYIRLTSQNRVNDSFRAQQGKITLHFRCFENTTALIIDTDHYMSDNYANNVVEYRLDSQKVQKKKFTVSNSKTALGLWNGGSSIPFIKAMFGKESFVLRYTPYSEGIKTAEFNILGLEEAIKPLRKACKW